MSLLTPLIHTTISTPLPIPIRERFLNKGTNSVIRDIPSKVLRAIHKYR